MRYLKNVWYQAAWCEELSSTPAIARRIMDTPLLIFRDAKGRACAIMDRCPHRFAPLSAGKVSDGSVSCGYHGLVFDGTGKCTHNPHGKISAAMRVAAFKVVERYQALWIWMGPGEADPALIPDLAFLDETPASARITGLLPTRAHYQLLVDNIMDLSHSDYLHPTTLGGVMTRAAIKVRSENEQIVVQYSIENCDPPPSFQLQVPPPNKADIWIDVRWFPAGVMVLGAGAKPAGTIPQNTQTTLTLHSMTPESQFSTHYFYGSTRPFLQDDANLSSLIKSLLEQAFVNEDKPMIEKQQMRMGDAEFWSLKPLVLSIDAGAVHVRRQLSALIQEEAGQPSLVAAADRQPRQFK